MPGSVNTMNVSALLLSLYPSSLLVDPMKSARSSRFCWHSGWAITSAAGCSNFICRTASSLNVSWTMQRPGQSVRSVRFAVEPTVRDSGLVRTAQGGFRDLPNQIHGVAACADQITLCLYSCCAVDVTHHQMIWMLGAKVSEFIGWAIVCQEQPASRSGSTTVFSGLRIFAVSAMKCTRRRRSRPHRCWRPFGTVQGISDEVGNVLNFWLLVVVRQDDGVALLFQLFDRRNQDGVSAHGDGTEAG